VSRYYPRTLDDSEGPIARITDEKFGQDPPLADVEGFSDSAVREVLLQLLELQIGKLRNQVVHRRAYRPNRAEIEKCRDDEIKVLYDAKRLLRIRSFEQWRAISSS
jgi:hypothetical protein